MDTVLQGRYRLLELMAEGGFARTYLAQDQGRFGERCVVKEFFPNASDAAVSQKAKELFQREAQTLYKLQHDQVPQFRASFTTEAGTDLRLFLVQDYVAGQTYRAVLSARLEQDNPFSEAEVRQLLTSLLPVLSYIHGQGIIHRDISLENLILRSPDRVPVLIDFGVVKTVVTQLQQSRVMPSGTVVGKFGYAPVEQLQSGRAYPSSDLYALAVCCLVLLTGQEPAQLFDDSSAVWNWRSRVHVTNEFANLLDRMLAHRPSDRFDSADAVLQSLYRLPEPIQSGRPTPVQQSQVSTADSSKVHTVAVASPAVLEDRRPRSQPVILPVQGVAPRNVPPEKAAARQDSSPPKSNLLGLSLIGLMTALLSAGLGWFIMQLSLQKSFQTRTPPVETQQSQPASTSSVRYSEALSLAPGQTTTVRGSIAAKDSQTYQISGNAGDLLSAQLSGSGTVFSILHADLTPVSADSQTAVSWRGTLSRSETYYVRIQNDSASTQAFQLNLALAEPAPPASEPTVSTSVSSSPSVSPSPTATPAADIILELMAKNPDQRLSGQLLPGQIQRYTVAGQAGQSLSAAVLGQASITLTIRNPAGDIINNAQKVLNWESLLPETGTYQIDVVPIDQSAKTDFAIAVGLHQL